MTVRAKTIIIISLTLFGLVGILYLTSRFLLLRIANNLEERQLYSIAIQARNTLNIDIEWLNTKLSDWAKWDDTVEFIQNGNQEYVRENFVESTFVDQRLNLIILLDNNGKVAYHQGFDLKAKRFTPVPASLRSFLAKHRSLQQFQVVTDNRSGIITLAEGPMIIAIRPITNSNGSAPIAGAFVTGRFLDASEVIELSKLSYLSLSMHLFHAEDLPEDFRIARDQFTEVRSIAAMAVNDRQAAGYTLINDIFGKPALILRAQKYRETFQFANTGLRINLLFFICIGLVFGCVVILLLERMVIARLARLIKSVTGIGKRGDPTARIALTGRDELSSLAGSVNEMLTALEKTQDELRTKEALRQSDERYRQLVELSPDAVLILSEGVVSFANDAGARLLGVAQPGDLIGQPQGSIIRSKNRRKFVKLFEQCFSGQEIIRTKMKVQRLDGEIIDVELALTPFTYQDQPAIQIIAHDISARKRVEEQLHYLAYYDALTGLPNRILSKNCLDQELAHARRERSRVAVLLLDLDRFKEVNDSLGHNIGDELLKAVAFRLTACVRESDMVARISGDEFAITLPDIKNGPEVEVTARRILKAFTEPFMIDSYEIFLTASIGISIYPSDGATIDILFKNADLGMYRAKALGRNTYQFFSPEIGAVLAERRSIENHLRKAIDKDELRVFYQPQIDLFKRSIIGVEALVRWQHPELGLIGPVKFINLAEETGIIGQIDEWVLRTACTQLRAWLDAGYPPFRVATNISARNFHRQEFLEFAMQVLNETGLPPHLLEMEITEMTAMQNIEQTHAVLDTLSALGINIAIDDFGTGYSSLYYLKHFPIHTLKIDRTFVQDILQDTDGAAIVDAIIAMAHSLKRTVIAEAVETEAQLDFLVAHHCDIVQGEIFGAAMPAAQFETLLRQQVWDASLLAIH